MAVEQYNQAYIRLANIQSDLAETSNKLVQAQEDLQAGKDQLNQRAASFYKAGQTVGLLDVLLSSKNLSDLIRTIDSVQAMSEHDAAVVAQVKRDKRAVNRAKRQLANRQQSEEGVTRILALKKSEIEKRLRSDQRDLAEVNSDIRRQGAEAEAEARIAQARVPVVAPLAPRAAKPKPKSGAGPGPKPAPPLTPPGPKAAQVVSLVQAQLGKPYLWAAAGPNAFDCSGLTMYVFGQVGVALPHSAEAQYNMGRRVSKEELQPGDLVFGAWGGYISHVGIYIGQDQYIHAPQSGDVVKISRVSTRRNYLGAVRIL